MNKKIILSICIIVLVLIISIFTWFQLHPTFDKSNPIIFEEQVNDGYTSIIYEGKEYVPYCAFSPNERDKYLGYVGEDKQDEIFTYKGHSEEEWIINYLDSGTMNDCMLLKEKSVTNIPEGLTSEYEWNTLSDLDKFYNNEATNEYKDIRELEDNYNKEQAQLDNCFVIGAMVHNDYLYYDFMEKYNNKETAFIRVAQNTVEGDLYLIDILYDANENKVKLVKDSTRDEFSAQEDRIIEYKTYERIGVWNYQNSEYWVAYNGELPDDTGAEYSISSDELFIITTIN